MISSLLIANRGEIARRIIRTAQRMGIRTIAVYADADEDAPHVRDADTSIKIGRAPAAESYLCGEKIIAAAHASGAQAIHPGYGFLSENAAFAQAVLDAGLKWVGPPPAAIAAMGLKDAAKSLMAKAGVPVTPGYHGEDQSPARLAKEAAAIGYPVLIKAVAGGGGKGMRRVDKAQDFETALTSARREAAGAFSDDRVLLETYVARPRHIEVQVFGDAHGNVVHLFERDCSLQRRHQKVIEEAPAPGMDAPTRATICEAAVKAAHAVSYEGAGTVEFIADASEGLRADRIWFMEMNTRLQVEHPVTEMITGLDMVEWQIRVASGERLPLLQDQIVMSGHAIEARLYAENPARKFLPSTGRLTRLRLPADSVRVDSGVEEGGVVTPFYDPMIAKLIVLEPDRASAAARLATACRSVEIWPVRSNAGFLARCLDHTDFIAADIDTGFIDRHLTALASVPVSQAAIDTAARSRLFRSLPGTLAGFRLNGDSVASGIDFTVDGEAMTAPSMPGDGVCPTVGQDPLIVFDNGETREVRFNTRAPVDSVTASDGGIRSPMPGRIVAINVAVGDKVAKGQTLAVLEAMKMEHTLAAPFAGQVTEIGPGAGAQVDEGVVLVRITAAP